MDPNTFIETNAPTPILVGRKRYFLLGAAILVLWLTYVALVEPLLFATKFETPIVFLACLVTSLFLGLLVWASIENDKDKVWGELLSKRLSNSDRSLRDNIQLADLLPENSRELKTTLSGPLVSDLKSKDVSGRQFNRRILQIVSLMAFFGIYAIFTESLKLGMLWLTGNLKPVNVDLAIMFFFGGMMLLIPSGIIALFNRSTTLLQGTGYTRIDRNSAKHRRYDFYKFNRQVLLDNGFEELFDARFDSTSCTFFASSNRDMIAEVGVFEYGRMYYGVKTATEDGKLFETRSGGFKKGEPSNPSAIQVCLCEKMPLEKLLRKHAVMLASNLMKSKSRLIILKDQVIDRLFLANRFRFTAWSMFTGQMSGSTPPADS